MMITSTNPMVYTDFPDPDIIRVGGVYYMATTTMHFTPGCDILRSYDLVHWEFIAHALNIVADTPEERLECEGANAYGRGMWAPSLRYHRGTWYVLFAANDTHTSYLLTASIRVNMPTHILCWNKWDTVWIVRWSASMWNVRRKV